MTSREARLKLHDALHEVRCEAANAADVMLCGETEDMAAAIRALGAAWCELLRVARETESGLHVVGVRVVTEEDGGLELASGLARAHAAVHGEEVAHG